MKDDYESIVHHNLLIIKRNNSSSKSSKLYIKVSYDKIEDLLHFLIGQNILDPIEIEVYDEKYIPNEKDYLIIQRFLVLINRFNINKISFFLSDTTFPIYSAIMKSINWSFANNTYMSLSINRNPLNKKKKDLILPSTPSKFLLPEEILIWQSEETLNKLNGKVDNQVLQDSVKLKKYIEELYAKIKSKYKIEQFTEFDKSLIISSILKRNFRKIDSSDDDIITPYQVIKQKGGNALGRARLMAILLNNEYMKTNATIIKGQYENRSHVWVGVLIDNLLYHCCPTYLRAFFDPDGIKCIPNKDEVYPKIYKSQAFNERRYAAEEKRVLSLIRRNYVE